METVSLHQFLQVLPCQVTLSIHIASGEGVVDVKGWLAGALLFGDFNTLVGVEVNFQALEEHLASLVSKVVPLRHLFLMDVLGLSITKLVLIVAVLWGEGLTEVAVLQLRVVVLVKATREVVNVVFVSVNTHLVEERQNLWSRDPAEVPLVKHLEGVHQIEVTLFGKLLFGHLDVVLVGDHFVQKLHHFPLVIHVQRTGFHLSTRGHN